MLQIGGGIRVDAAKSKIKRKKWDLKKDVRDRFLVFMA